MAIVPILGTLMKEGPVRPRTGSGVDVLVPTAVGLSE